MCRSTERALFRCLGVIGLLPIRAGLNRVRSDQANRRDPVCVSRYSSPGVVDIAIRTALAWRGVAHLSFPNDLPYAAGIQPAVLGRQVIACVGDGGFAMLMAECLTAVRASRIGATVVRRQ